MMLFIALVCSILYTAGIQSATALHKGGRGGEGPSKPLQYTQVPTDSKQEAEQEMQRQSIPAAMTYGTCFFQGHGAADLRGLSPPSLTLWTGGVSQLT